MDVEWSIDSKPDYKPWDERDDMIAWAQTQENIKWLSATCTEHPGEVIRRDCPICWEKFTHDAGLPPYRLDEVIDA